MNRTRLKKIYWTILNFFLPRQIAQKLNLVLRCLFEDWDFAANLYLFSSDIAVSDGRIKKLSPEEARIRDEANKKAISDPELIEKAIEENKQRYKNKIRRKGYN